MTSKKKPIIILAICVIVVAIFVGYEIVKDIQFKKYVNDKNEYLNLTVEYSKLWAENDSALEYTHSDSIKNGSDYYLDTRKHEEIITIKVDSSFDLLEGLARFDKAVEICEDFIKQKKDFVKNQFVIEGVSYEHDFSISHTSQELEWRKSKGRGLLFNEDWHTTLVIKTDENTYKYFPGVQVFEDSDGEQSTRNFYLENRPTTPSPSTPSGSNYSLVTDDNELGACWALAKDVVKSQLKSPSSAKFPFSYSNRDVSITKSGKIYTVKAWVDADNSFGATIRNNFIVTMEKNGDKFTAISCVIK